MKFTSTPASLESTSRGAPIRFLSRLFLFALLSAFALPPAFAQYRTYPIYTNVSSVPAGSYGTTIVASVDDSSITANFKVCFDTGYGSSKVPIVPYAYVSYGDFAQFNFDVPPSTIQAVPPSAFASGSFNVSIYSVPTTFTACNGNEGGASQGNTVTLNYPVLSTVSLPDLPEQNVALTSREPSSLSLTGQNFISNSGTNGKVPSAVNFISSTTLAGTGKYLTGYSLRSTIPTTIPAAATSVNIQVCNTATYSYCSNSLTLKTAALQQNPGTLTASPSPALTTQPVTLTASFGPAMHSVAGAPSGPVTFGDWGSTLGTANLVLDKTATFAQAPTQQFLVYASPLAPIVADFNGDGIPDTLFIDPGNINYAGSSLNLLLGTVPSGSFQANQQFYILSDGPSFIISSAAVGDFNGDGIPDIVLLAAEPDYNTGLALYTMLGNGDGTFQDGFSSSPTLYGSQIVAGDFNKDGKLDIVIAGALDANGTIGLQTLPGDGTGNFTGGPATTGLRTEPSPYFGDFKVAAADFNADGYPDIAVMNGYSPSGQLDNSIEVYQNNGKGVFLAPVRVATDGTPTANFSIAALGPGLPLDIIITSTASSIPGIDVALNQSTTAKIAFFGTFEDTEVPGITQAVTGDFDGDGLLDIAVDDGKTIHVLSGNGFGAFTATYPDLSIVPPGTTLIAGSDENGDKYADLLLYTTGTQNSNNEYPITLYDYITSGTATATFPPVSFAAGSHPLHASTNGTFDLLAGTATATLIVTAPAASSVTLTASPTSPANYGIAKIILTASIPVANATGSVSFYNGTTLLGTEPLVDATSSTATFTVATPAAGTYSFKAVYGGDTTHGGGTSAVLPYVVNPIAATITWTPNPSTIVYGTALSAAQLNATATSVTGAPVAGSFTYAPALGTILTAGTHSIVATFTPADTNYSTTSATRNITVTQATPVITWLPNPATITYGTPLSAAQLDATSTTPGTFVYTPALGTVLNAGTHSLSVAFTPTDTTDFTTASKTVTITVDASGLTLSANSLQFGDQPYGTTSPAQTVTVTNPGTSAIAIYSIGSTLGLDPQDFLATSNCPASLAPGATCQIGVTFTPAGVGARSAGVAITDNSTPSSQTINVGGTGTGGILQVNPGDLQTIAGNGTAGYAGDHNPAMTAELNLPDGIAFDPAGNFYIADTSNNVIRKVDTAGTITTFAGNGTAGYMGDNEAATSAELNQPYSVVSDSVGNIYIEDTHNYVIRKVDANGIITTIAGTGVKGHGGDGNPATSATFSDPQGARFDSLGNLYIADCVAASVRKIDTKGIVTTVAGNFIAGYNGDGIPATTAELSCPSGVAFDAAGNFYIADYGNSRIRKVDTNGIISTIAGTGTAGATGDGGPATAATFNLPNDVVFDSIGNLYIADSGNNRIRKIDTTGIVTTAAGGLNSAGSAGVNSPSALAIDKAGNVYFSDSGNSAIREIVPQSTSSFPATVIGTAAAPQTVTLSNIGNVPIAIPASGSFTLSGNASDFSLTGGTCLSGATLAVNESTCTLQVSFTPTAVGPRTLRVSIADNALNSPQSFTIGGTGTAAIPTLTWTPPASITYGTPLSAAQLDAVATGLAGAAVAGTYAYTPAAGTVLTAGTHSLSVVFTSTNPNYSGATAAVPITVTQAVPAVTWTPTPSTIAYGTPLSTTQLDATSTTPGTFTYTPALGAVLPAGTQTLSVLFTPTDAFDFTSVTKTASITVTAASPAVTWLPNPAAITYGTPLSAAQLDATSTTPGTFTYTPAIGAVLTAGTQTLSVLFTPTNTTDFKPVTATTTITVAQAKPVLSWTTPAAIVSGTPLSATQLDATVVGVNGVALPGTFTYTPPAGTVLPAGTSTLSVLFTPTDSVDYTTATGTVVQSVTVPATTTTLTSSLAQSVFGQPVLFTAVTTSTQPVTGKVNFYDGSALIGSSSGSPATLTLSTLTAGRHSISAVFVASSSFGGSTSVPMALTVSPAPTTVAWTPNPATIGYGSPLTAAQLDATSSTAYAPTVAGTFVYTPALGTVLPAGSQTLQVAFTPTDTIDFLASTGTAQITVTGGTPVIVWVPNPATIAYGTPLSAAQLDATSSTPGTFTYTPALGTVLTAGTQTLSVLFTPTDTTHYKSVTITVPITVTQATPAVTWTPNPATIPYGTPLSAAQLDATSTTPGAFTYTPALGTVLTAGTQTLSAIFTPKDTTDFKSVTTTVSIVVTAVSPTVTWTPNPATIPYGTALNTAQLDATSSIPGTFAYTPALGTVLSAGTQTLTSVFTPTDATDFKSITSKVTIVVTTVAPSITWTPNPATIGYGTPLSAAQLDATASTPGTFLYTPALGSVLAIGTQTLSVTFTPTDATDFKPVTTTATITVTTAVPSVTWTPSPATITYGTALTAAQLDATAATPGTFIYSPGLGTILPVGTQTLSVLFTPTDSTDFKPVTTTATITVTTAVPSVTWTPSPATITYGTALTAAQLDATATIPGTFSYNPALGTVLPAGTQTLSTLFTPTDSKDFKSVSTTATITVSQATPAVTWTPVPANITYGTALSAAQLDATSTTPGTFSYNPALGNVLTAGTQILSVSFTPSDPKNFKSVTTTATIKVAQATPTISWAAPASIVVGTALSSAQLDAIATAPNGAALPGTFVYTPAAGTLLTAGTQTLKVAFTPTDLADYATAAASVSLQVIPVTLTALSTSTAALGDPAKTITLTGTGFVPSASVLVNGSGIPTTFVNPTTLTAVMPAADFLMTQILEISVTEPTQNQTTASLPFLVGAPPADAVFTGPSVIFSGTQTGLTFQLPKSYPVDLTATFTLNFTPATGLPNDPTVVFASGGNTFVATIPANSTTVPSVQIQSGTVAGTISVALALEADGVNVTPASIQPLTIQTPLAVPGLTSAALTRNGNTLTVAVRGFSNPRDMTSARFHFTPVPGGSIGNEDVTIDVVPIFTTWYADPASSQYGSSFTYTQIFNLSSDASVVGQVSVTLVNSVGDSMGANTP